MRNVRRIVNGASLLVICGGAFMSKPAQGELADGGTCCDQTGATCVIFPPSGNPYVQKGAYYEATPPCPTGGGGGGEI